MNGTSVSIPVTHKNECTTYKEYVWQGKLLWYKGIGEEVWLTFPLSPLRLYDNTTNSMSWWRRWFGFRRVFNFLDFRPVAAEKRGGSSPKSETTTTLVASRDSLTSYPIDWYSLRFSTLIIWKLDDWHWLAILDWYGMAQLHMTAHGHFHVAHFWVWRSFIAQNGAIFYIRRLGCCALAGGCIWSWLFWGIWIWTWGGWTCIGTGCGSGGCAWTR